MSTIQSGTVFRENIEVGCDCFNPNLIQIVTSVSAFDYVKYKKNYVSKYLTNLIIHKSKDLIGLKKCFGKQRTNSKLLRSSYRSHQLTLRRFKQYTSDTNESEKILLHTTSLTARKYIETAESLCQTFDQILTNVVGEKQTVDIDLVVKSCQFQLQTLNIFEKIITENGVSSSPLQYKSFENAAIQLV